MGLWVPEVVILDVLVKALRKLRVTYQFPFLDAQYG